MKAPTERPPDQRQSIEKEAQRIADDYDPTQGYEYNSAQDSATLEVSFTVIVNGVIHRGELALAVDERLRDEVDRYHRGIFADADLIAANDLHLARVAIPDDQKRDRVLRELRKGRLDASHIQGAATKLKRQDASHERMERDVRLHDAQQNSRRQRSGTNRVRTRSATRSGNHARAASCGTTRVAGTRRKTTAASGASDGSPRCSDDDGDPAHQLGSLYPRVSIVRCAT